MGMTFQQEFPNEFIDGSKDDVIELPQEYISWLDERQDLGFLIAVAIRNFLDACHHSELPEELTTELVKVYGRTLIEREMGAPQR